MKFNLEMKDVTCGGMVVVGSLTINAEASDEMLVKCYDTLAALTETLLNPPKTTCTCHASDEDKRPPENKIRVMHHPGKTSGARDNYFAPMDVE